jgi:predicted nucleotidyltransferase component of viral defense system
VIDKREILAVAQQTSLTPHVVEKDYVLGWILAGIYNHEALANNWIFKGGTPANPRYQSERAITRRIWRVFAFYAVKSP